MSWSFEGNVRPAQESRGRNLISAQLRETRRPVAEKPITPFCTLNTWSEKLRSGASAALFAAAAAAGPRTRKMYQVLRRSILGALFSLGEAARRLRGRGGGGESSPVHLLTLRRAFKGLANKLLSASVGQQSITHESDLTSYTRGASYKLLLSSGIIARIVALFVGTSGGRSFRLPRRHFVCRTSTGTGGAGQAAADANQVMRIVWPELLK